MTENATPNANVLTDILLTNRLGVPVTGGIAHGLFSLTERQGRVLDNISARVRQSTDGLRIDLGRGQDSLPSILGNSRPEVDLGRYPRGYAAPSVFVDWLSLFTESGLVVLA